MKDRCVAIVQARLTSSRLPGKVLRPLAGRAVILHVVDRLRCVEGLDEVVVAVPATPEDRPLIKFLLAHDVAVFSYCGPTEDLLGRYVAAGQALAATRILMVDSDCPLFDPKTASRMVAALRDNPDAEYVRLAPFSIEGGVACLRLSTFERIDEEGAVGADREHATLQILREPDKFKIKDIPVEDAFSDPADAHRFWLDTQADYEFLNEIYTRLWNGSDIVDLRAVLALLRDEPQLRDINSHVRQNDPLNSSSKASGGGHV